MFRINSFSVISHISKHLKKVRNSWVISDPRISIKGHSAHTKDINLYVYMWKIRGGEGGSNEDKKR